MAHDFVPTTVGVVPVLGTSIVDAQDARAGLSLSDNLGTYHYAITTSVPRARRHFDRRLRLHYAFNHTEGIRVLAEAPRGETPTAAFPKPWATADVPRPSASQ